MATKQELDLNNIISTPSSFYEYTDEKIVQILSSRYVFFYYLFIYLFNNPLSYLFTEKGNIHHNFKTTRKKNYKEI